MPQLVRMPSWAVLPEGDRRRFVAELHEHYQAARRPQLRTIADLIASHDGFSGSASRETIRRMLNGSTVPARWGNAEAVFLALCELAGRDPDSAKFQDSWSYGDTTWAEEFLLRWNAALDEPEPDPPAPHDPDEAPF